MGVEQPKCARTATSTERFKELEVGSTFADRFKELVGDTPYREVGEHLSLSASMVSYYISGKRSPKIQTVTFIANHYHVDPVWLMGSDVPKYKENTPDVSIEDMNTAQVEYVSTFPERFSELVEGKTVIEAGEMLGISKTTVSAYKTGKRSPKSPVLNSIAHYFHVDPFWLKGMNVPKYKEKAPNVSAEGMNKDRARLIQTINRMSDDQVRALQVIADQLLSLREK